MKPIVEKIKLTNLGKCKVIILILFSIIAFSLINLFNTVDASTTYEEGGITAVLDDNGTLTISGSGEITKSLIRKFDYEKSIKNVKIENGATSIGYEAFYYCKSLANIEIPSSVTSIGDEAFKKCTSLERINVNQNNEKYTNDEKGVLYNKNKTELIQYPAGKKDTEYSIPEGVTSIGSFAFANCTSLTNIEIPSSVTSIGKYAFSSCTSLTRIEIPEGVTSIGRDAFYGCENLTSIEIPSSVTSIGYEAFSDCTSLERINVNKNNKNYSNDEKGVLYNKNKTELIKYPVGKKDTEYSILEGVTSIESDAFRNCTSLTRIEIPEGVTSIGSFAFANCTSLTKIEIPEGVTSIGGRAFSDCTSLTNIEIPEGVTTIGERAFYYCESLTSIEIPSSVTSIESCAFAYCTSLTRIEIPEGVTSIGWYAFENCESLTRIEIPSSVTSIGIDAFYNCTSLERINVNQNNEEYTNDEKGVLYNKNKTKLIQYPAGKKDIEYSMPAGVTSIESDAFRNCTSLTSIEIPSSVTSIGYEAFSYCKNLTSIVIPEGVTEIGDDAFKKCTSLTIYCKSNTTALQYAIDNEIDYVIDDGGPELTVTGNPENWTKGEVTLTIQASDKLSGLKNVKVNNEEITIKEGTGTYKIKDNGTYTVIATDNLGNTKTQKVEVTKIDNDMPTKTKPTAESTIKSITVTCKQTDENSGLQKVEYAIYKDNSWSNWQIENVFEGLSKKTCYKVKTRATDKAGNIEESEETIIETKEYILGDINKNDKIDVADILQILRHMSAEKTQKNKDWLLSQEDQEIADVNQNKKVDVQDALLIRRYIAASKNEEIAQKHPDWIK